MPDGNPEFIIPFIGKIFPIWIDLFFKSIWILKPRQNERLTVTGKVTETEDN